MEAREISAVLVKDQLECLGTFPGPHPVGNTEPDVFEAAATKRVDLDCCESAVPGEIARIWNPDDLQEELQKELTDSVPDVQADSVLRAEPEDSESARDMLGDFVPDIHGTDGYPIPLIVVLEYRRDMEPADQ